MVPRLGYVCVSLVALMCVVAPHPAAAMGLGVDSVAKFEENELRQGDTVVRLVRYNGQLFRRIEVSDLGGLAVGDTPLHGLLVCVEGKFQRYMPPNVFRLYGSENPFAFGPKQRNAVVGLMAGENVWVAGMAQKLKTGGSCFMAVQAVIRLGHDLPLFGKRFEYYKGQGNWRRLIELGRWIERSGEQGIKTRIEDKNSYRKRRDKAFRQALKIRKDEIGPDDADALYELARMHVDLLGQIGVFDATDHLLKAVAAKPDHVGATDLLVELGYVLYEGQWLTKDEVDAKERDKRRVVTPTETPEVKPDIPDTPTTLPVKGTPGEPTVAKRMRRIAELEMRIRMSASGMKSVADDLKNEPASVARRLVWVFANTGGTIGLEALLIAGTSGDPAVRRDVADALAGTGELADLSVLISSDDDAGVKSHGVDAMVSIGTNESTNRLVSLLEDVKGPTHTKVVAALTGLTGQRFENDSQWRSWWQQNRDEYKGPMEQ